MSFQLKFYWCVMLKVSVHLHRQLLKLFFNPFTGWLTGHFHFLFSSRYNFLSAVILFFYSVTTMMTVGTRISTARGKLVWTACTRCHEWLQFTMNGAAASEYAWILVRYLQNASLPVSLPLNDTPVHRARVQTGRQATLLSRRDGWSAVRSHLSRGV